MTKTASSSSGSSSTATVATAIASVGLGHGNGNGNGGNGKEVASTSQQRVTNSGVVRRRSWRTHYTRPNKSLEESGNVREVSLLNKFRKNYSILPEVVENSTNYTF